MGLRSVQLLTSLVLLQLPELGGEFKFHFENGGAQHMIAG